MKEYLQRAKELYNSMWLFRRHAHFIAVLREYNLQHLIIYSIFLFGRSKSSFTLKVSCCFFTLILFLKYNDFIVLLCLFVSFVFVVNVCAILMYLCVLVMMPHTPLLVQKCVILSCLVVV